MSRNTYFKKVNSELKKVNEIIDFKILHGLSYREERRIHRELLNQLGSFQKSRSVFNLFSFF